MPIRFQAQIAYNGIPSLRTRILFQTRAAANATADHIAEVARQGAPVRTGFLRDSIRAVGIEVSVGAFYGAWVNYGTRFMAAQPFWDQAVESGKRLFVTKMTEALRP